MSSPFTRLVAQGLQINNLGELEFMGRCVLHGTQAHHTWEVAHAPVHLGQQAGGNGAVPGQVDEQRGRLPFFAAEGDLVGQGARLRRVGQGGVKLGGRVYHLYRHLCLGGQVVYLLWRERVGEVDEAHFFRRGGGFENCKLSSNSNENQKYKVS